MTTEAKTSTSDAKAAAAGGRVSIYRRKNSRFWQCQCSIEGEIYRVSARTEDLAEAQRFATHWFIKLMEANGGSDLPAALAVNSAELNTAANPPFSVPTPNDKSDRIVSAAVLLVTENGFRNAQMSGIAEKSGLALSTIYRYFPSKNELMRNVVARVAGREVNAAAGASMSEGTPIARLEVSIRTFAERAVRGWRLAHALVAEPVDADIEMERLLYRRRLERVYESLIREGMSQGTIIEQDPEVSAGCIVGALFEGLVGPLALQARLSESDRMIRAERIVTFCIRGVVGVGQP